MFGTGFDLLITNQYIYIFRFKLLKTNKTNCNVRTFNQRNF